MKRLPQGLLNRKRERKDGVMKYKVGTAGSENEWWLSRDQGLQIEDKKYSPNSRTEVSLVDILILVQF